jgi:hypothetical protein
MRLKAKNNYAQTLLNPSSYLGTRFLVNDAPFIPCTPLFIKKFLLIASFISG